MYATRSVLTAIDCNEKPITRIDEMNATVKYEYQRFSLNDIPAMYVLIVI